MDRASLPEQVFRELQADSAANSSEWAAGDKALEQSLFARNEPLIDLALAQFGTEQEIVSKIYNRASATDANSLDERFKLGLKVACLSNRRLWSPFGSFPHQIVGEKEFARLVQAGSYDECCAFLQNPRLDEKHLVALYAGAEPFARLDDERWRWMVHASAKNPRLTHEHDYDDGPDLGFLHVHRGILRLLEIAPATRQWLWTVYYFVRTLKPKQVCQLDDPRPILDRWRRVSVTDEGKTPEEGLFTGLPVNEELACYLAALFGRKLANAGGARSSDVMVRCAHYATSKLVAKDFEKLFSRDGVVFVLAALMNDNLLRDREIREAFSAYLGGDLWDIFDARTKELRVGRYAFPYEDGTQAAARLHAEINAQLSALRARISTLGWTIIIALIVGFWLMRR